MTIRIGALQFAVDVGENAANKLKAAGLVTMCYSTLAMTHIVCEFVSSQPEIVQMVQTAVIPALTQAVQAVKSGNSPIFGSSYLSVWGASIGTAIAASSFADLMVKAKTFLNERKAALQGSPQTRAPSNGANSFEL